MKVKGQGEVDLLDVLIGTEKVVNFLNDMCEGRMPEGQVTQADVQQFMAMMGTVMLVALDFHRQQAENAVVAEALGILEGG